MDTNAFPLAAKDFAADGVRPRPARPRSHLWVALPATLVLVVAITASLPARVTVARPAAMPLRDDAVGRGFVKAKKIAGVGARINGVIVATHVDQGDRVRAGQIIAELQNGDAHGQLRQATHQLSSQRAGVDAARANVAAVEARLRASVSALEKAKAALRLSELTHRRTDALHQSGIASREALDYAEALHTTAARDVDTAEALRAASEQELVAARHDAGAAVTLADVSSAAVDVQHANLAWTVVRSPFDGYVVTRELECGATVVPGLPIFTIADPSVMWISANVDEREAGGLRVGQPATITLRSRPGHRIAGRVARIAQQADPITEELTVDVTFTRSGDVTLNETAEVEILKHVKARALAVPATASVAGPDGPAVWIVRGSRLVLQPIETGVRDKRGWIEVTGGLTPSDLVVVNPSIESAPLSSGRRVRTRRMVSP